jgi:hypothetical protein
VCTRSFVGSFELSWVLRCIFSEASARRRPIPNLRPSSDLTDDHFSWTVGERKEVSLQTR